MAAPVDPQPDPPPDEPVQPQDEPTLEDLEAYDLAHCPSLNDVLDAILGGAWLDPEGDGRPDPERRTR